MPHQDGGGDHSFMWILSHPVTYITGITITILTAFATDPITAITVLFSLFIDQAGSILTFSSIVTFTLGDKIGWLPDLVPVIVVTAAIVAAKIGNSLLDSFANRVSSTMEEEDT